MLKFMDMEARSFFSVSYDLVCVGTVMPYDLYVNSSALKEKQKFIRIFPEGEELTSDDLKGLKEKYHQLYVPEDQRQSYMKSLVKSEQVDDVEATNFIKDSAIKYLQNIFDDEKEFSTELLSETIGECRDAVENMIDVLDDYNIDSLRGLIGSLSGHDFYTYDHSINVSMYCITIMRTLKPNASRSELLHAGLGGLLHDLGKIKVPTKILNSPSGLTDEEYEIIKKHPTYGIDLLKSGECQVEDDLDLEIIARIVHEHHENWGGGGYPLGIKEKEIHLLARICTIADFFDAITTKRSYSEVLPISKALDVMEKTSGKKLDPKLFKVFASHVKYSKVESTHELKMADSFDPSIPYEKLPLEEVKKMFEEEDFGKIKFADGADEVKKSKK
jgi:HD-GYP domain-containing protein (c-di-GMP phosphodiesterase class II)